MLKGNANEFFRTAQQRKLLLQAPCGLAIYLTLVINLVVISLGRIEVGSSTLQIISNNSWCYFSCYNPFIVLPSSPLLLLLKYIAFNLMINSLPSVMIIAERCPCHIGLFFWRRCKQSSVCGKQVLNLKCCFNERLDTSTKMVYSQEVIDSINKAIN